MIHVLVLKLYEGVIKYLHLLKVQWMIIILNKIYLVTLKNTTNTLIKGICHFLLLDHYNWPIIYEIWLNYWSKFGEKVQKKSLYGSLMDMLDSKDPLIVLADTIKGRNLKMNLHNITLKREDQLNQFCLMVGLLLLKQLENLSDENVVIAWKRNPYFNISVDLVISKQHYHVIVPI